MTGKSLYFIAIRLLILLANFLAIPFVIKNSGVENYGVYVAAFALSTILTFLDLGVPSALISRISSERTHDNFEMIYKLISTSAIMILAFSSLISSSLYIVFFHSNLDEILLNKFQIPSQVASTYVNCMLIFCILNPFASLGNRILFGLGRSSQAFSFNLFSNVIGISSLIVGSKFNEPLLAMFVSSLVLTPSLSLCVWVYIFRLNPRLLPNLRYVDKRLLSPLLRVGSFFLSLQLINVIGTQLDAVYVLTLLDAESAATIAVVTKFVMIPYGLAYFVFQPLWAISAEKFSHGRLDEVRLDLFSAIRSSIIVLIPVSLGLVSFGEEFISKWTQGTLLPKSELIYSCVLLLVIMTIIQPVSMVLNGIEAHRFQIVVAPVYLICNVFLSIYLTSKLGVTGPIWGSILSLTFTNLIPSILYVFRRTKFS